MNCLRCGAAMYRVQNPDGSSKASCHRCSQYVDCARCQRCGNTACLACYNKAVTSAGQPNKISEGPLIEGDQEI